MRISDWSSDVCSSDLYADLGFTDAEEMLVKAQLVTKIGDIIKQRKLTQQQAAELMGMRQGRVSNMLRGHFHGQIGRAACRGRVFQDESISAYGVSVKKKKTMRNIVIPGKRKSE